MNFTRKEVKLMKILKMAVPLVSLAAIGLLYSATAAPAPQPNQTQVFSSFTLIARAPDLSVTSASSNVALGASAPVAFVCNDGSVTAYVALGTSSGLTVTTANGNPVLAGFCVNLNATGQTYIAGITATSSTTLHISLGTGLASRGGGSGGGGGSPSGPAGGDLAGSYPNPTVANLSNVTNASLPNAGLANSSITFGSTAVALGSTVTNLNGVNLGPTTPGTGAFTTLSATGAALFSNTTAPTLAAGSLALGGTLGTPNNPSGNGEGQIYLSSTNGLVIQGQGSSFDLSLFGRAGSGCQFNSSANLSCTGQVSASSLEAAASQLIFWGGRGILSSPAAATIQLGSADAASPVAQTLQVQSVVAGTSNTNGVNATIIGSRSTGTGTSGDIIFQTGGTGAGTTVQNSAVTALTIKGATQIVQLNAITSDATHTDATVCEDTTTHGLYSGSGAAGICLGTSSIRFKHDIVPLQAGLPQIMALQPIRYRLNADHGDPNKPLYGFTAEQGGTVLPDLMGRDAQGRPNTFDYLGVVPVLVRAIQEQQAEIAELRNQLHRHH